MYLWRGVNVRWRDDIGGHYRMGSAVVRVGQKRRLAKAFVYASFVAGNRGGRVEANLFVASSARFMHPTARKKDALVGTTPLPIALPIRGISANLGQTFFCDRPSIRPRAAICHPYWEPIQLPISRLMDTSRRAAPVCLKKGTSDAA